MMHLKHLLPSIVIQAIILALLAGCAQIDTLRLAEDQPADLETLMEQQEYERARQLLNQYPYLDTSQRRQDLNLRIARYENSALATSQSRAAEHDLYSAVVELDRALEKLPHSSRLLDYRNTLEAQRTARVRENERQQLLARARYNLAQRDLYQEQLNLHPPSLGKRWSHTLYRKQADSIRDELLACGKDAMARDELDMAEECLQLAMAYDDTSDAGVVLAGLRERRTSERHVEEEKAEVTRVKQAKRLKKKRRSRTQLLLAQTEQALDAGDLLEARNRFYQLPDPDSMAAEVVAVRTRLNDALDRQVEKLVAEGDRQYRADRVSAAISSWNQALALQPGNNMVQDRLERANKVLARLEELKNKQK